MRILIQIAIAVNARLFTETKFRVVGSNPNDRGWTTECLKDVKFIVLDSRQAVSRKTVQTVFTVGPVLRNTQCSEL